MNIWLHMFTACRSMLVAETFLNCADPLGAWNEPHYLSSSTLSSPSKKSWNSNYSCNLPTVQARTGLPAHNGVFMKNGTKKEWNPSPNILSFSTSFSSPPRLLCPGPADTFYYSPTAAMHSLTLSVTRWTGSALCLDCL